MLKKGMNSVEAAVTGTQRMAVPVIFSALTTVVAFTPSLQLPGLFGKFPGDIPRIVIIVLLLSLLQSLFLLPRNPASIDFSADHRPNVVPRVLPRLRGSINAALRRSINGPLYGMLTFTTNRWTVPLAAVTAMMILTIALVKHGYVKFSFFPAVEGSFVTADIEMADGTAFSRTEFVAEAVRRAAIDAGEAIARDAVGLRSAPIEGISAVAGQGASTTEPNGGVG